MDLEVRNFKAEGNVLADIWSESVIDEHPVVAPYINPEDRDLNARATEDWEKQACVSISVHVADREV